MKHRQQQTLYGCGVACVAMLANLPVKAIAAALPSARVSDRRRRFKREYVNVGEFRRLLADRGMTLGHRTKGLPVNDLTVAVLRVPNGRSTGWHWCVLSAGRVHDPILDRPLTTSRYKPINNVDVSFYPVTDNRATANRRRSKHARAA